MLAMVTFSYPQIKTKFVDTNSIGLLPWYSVTHTLIAKNKNDEEVQRHIDAVPVGYDNLSTFVLPHQENQNRYLVVAEVFKVEAAKLEADPLNATKSSTEIIGIGRKTIPGIQPLTSSKELLELSDLLIGVKNPSETESQRLLFPLVPSSRILATDILKIYLEIYHLDF